MIHVDKFGDIYVIHIDKFGPLITERFLAKNINSLQEWALSR